jgi:hypothetical protein
MSTKEEIIASAEIIDAELSRLRKIERLYNTLVDEQEKVLETKRKHNSFTFTEEELMAMRDEQLRQYDEEWAVAIKKLDSPIF